MKRPGGAVRRPFHRSIDINGAAMSGGEPAGTRGTHTEPHATLRLGVLPRERESTSRG
jgi:hypothetical protein